MGENANTMDNNVYAIPVHKNQFEPIVRNVSGINVDLRSNHRNVTQIQQNKIPPIITKIGYIHMVEMMRKLKIEKYGLKLIKVGVKVILFNESDFDKTLSEIKGAGQECYSFTKKENQTTKFVLYGLPDMEPQLVADSLKDEGFEPLKVQKIELKTKRFDNDAVYYVFYKKASVKLSQLKNIRYVAHVACNWDIYQNRPNRLTQCFKCFMFGHGAINCYMVPKCRYCTMVHNESEICPLNEDVTKHLCANCKGNHTANSVICPARSKYLEMKKQMSIKQHLQSKQAPQHHNIGFQWSSKDFPDPANRISQPKSTYQTTGLTTGYADAVKSNELFTINELFSIFSEIVEKSKYCKTKSEQIQMLSEVAYRYAGQS